MVSGPATSVFLLAQRQSARLTSWLLGNRRERHSTGLTELKAAAASDDKGVFKPGPTGKERSCHFCVEIMHEGSQADCQHLEGAQGQAGLHRWISSPEPHDPSWLGGITQVNCGTSSCGSGTIHNACIRISSPSLMPPGERYCPHGNLNSHTEVGRRGGSSPSTERHAFDMFLS